jgi:hypothetical protein
MRYYSYNEYNPDITVEEKVIIVSEEDIRRDYYPQWHSRMSAKFGKDHVDANYSFEDALDDWVVVNYAWEVRRDAGAEVDADRPAGV